MNANNQQPALVLSFDMDQVLVPSPIGNRVFPMLTAELTAAINDQRTDGPEISPDELRRRAHAEWERRVRDGNDMVAAYDWDDIFTDVVRGLGLSREVRVTPYIEALCEHPDDVPQYPEVPAQLAQLRDQGAPLLLITNGHARYQLPILRALDLERFFDRIATPDRAGYGKPDPRIFEWAFRGLAGRRNVHVGDRLRHDVYGPHQAGLEAVWLRRDLPAALAALPPAERLASPHARAFFEEQLREEGVTTEDSTPYWPDFLAKDLGELPALLNLETSAASL